LLKLPDYIGPLAFGVKMGVILPGTDLLSEIVAALKKVAADGLLADSDVICVTESVVARAQENYVTLDQVAAEVKNKLKIEKNSKVGVVFPIASRNRFAMVLEGIAKAVPEGEVIVQLSYPCDEVGNQVISPYLAEKLTPAGGIIALSELTPDHCLHPVTKVNYPVMYQEIIEGQGAKANIIFANDPLAVLQSDPDGVIVADIHNRRQTQQKLLSHFANVITLQDLCNEGKYSSEWGLLGSNMSAGDKLKLAPQNADGFAKDLQQQVLAATGKQVEVLVYGDGAYKDPSTGIYELADPMPVFGKTDGFHGRFREGIKYKYLADVCYEEGKSREEIEAALAEQNLAALPDDLELTEGTTPRRIEDVIASLADLVSGSADAGTPVIVVKGFL